MPFISLNPAFNLIDIYYELSESEKGELLTELSKYPILLNAVRFYEEEKRYLDEYYQTTQNASQISAFRVYPAYLKPANMSKQACLITIAANGESHGNEFNKKTDFGVIGCFPRDVENYKTQLPKSEEFSIEKALAYKATVDYQSKNYTRDLIITTNVELFHALKGHDPFMPISETEAINTTFTLEGPAYNDALYIDRLRYFMAEKKREATGGITTLTTEGVFNNQTKVPNITEIIKEIEHLDIDMNEGFLTQMINKAANGV